MPDPVEPLLKLEGRVSKANINKQVRDGDWWYSVHLNIRDAMNTWHLKLWVSHLQIKIITALRGKTVRFLAYYCPHFWENGLPPMVATLDGPGYSTIRFGCLDTVQNAVHNGGEAADESLDFTFTLKFKDDLAPGEVENTVKRFYLLENVLTGRQMVLSMYWHATCIDQEPVIKEGKIYKAFYVGHYGNNTVRMIYSNHSEIYEWGNIPEE
ncbi:unnamed protein product, partial [Mesorhabditis spiculigera]